MKFDVLPHPKAPLFPDAESGQKVFENLLVALQHNAVGDLDVQNILRQAGLVNLWFFLKFIAGATGPFHFLNTGVHLDMCNFRQSDVCFRDGAHVAVFLPRGFAKTTIFTEGAIAWELLRDPNKCYRIVNATINRASRFKNVVQRVFDTNPMVAALYPETVPKTAAKRWNDTEMVMPNATRLHKEASLSAGGVEGAPEGDHFDLLQMDDIVGMDDVDANFNAGLSMDKAITWFDMHETLLNSRMKSRSVVVATRYGPGDVYAKICSNTREVYGFDNNSFKRKTDGAWDIYYRHAVENGEATNPFVITAEAYSKLLRESPLVAAYQYANDVTISVVAEFAQLKTKRCSLAFSQAENEFYIVRDDEGPDERVKVAECECCISVDWAGSDRKKSVHTSRTSIGVWARDHANRCYRFDQSVGYFALPTVFEKIFQLHEKWQGYVGAVLLEANAMQRGIFDLIVQEQEKRGTWMNIKKRNAVGDKVVRIRSTLGMHLAKGLIYLKDDCSAEFIEEKLAFPSPRLDVLDESEKALSWLATPESDEHKEARALEQEAAHVFGAHKVETFADADEHVNLFGY